MAYIHAWPANYINTKLQSSLADDPKNVPMNGPVIADMTCTTNCQQCSQWDEFAANFITYYAIVVVFGGGAGDDGGVVDGALG